jgi:hypothetical protein
MSKQIKYSCSCCGQEHAEWPALTYISPTNYERLTQADKDNLGKLTSDLCTIHHADQIDRFIRVTMSLKVIDHCEDLEYGLWVSLSEESFNDYSDNYHNENHVASYFGWLCNDLPDYDFNDSIPTTVTTRTGNQRPEIIPHEDFEHAFTKDYYNGITKLEAERRIRAMLDLIEQRNNSNHKRKAWWKVW